MAFTKTEQKLLLKGLSHTTFTIQTGYYPTRKSGGYGKREIKGIKALNKKRLAVPINSFTGRDGTLTYRVERWKLTSKGMEVAVDLHVSNAKKGEHL
jgi:hypothetical protein